MGFCVMRVNENQPQADSPSRSAMAQHDPPAADNLSPDLKGFAGIHGKIMSEKIKTLSCHGQIRLWRRKEVSKMPGGDGTGPLGMGPMTGRAAGFCAGYGMPGYMNPIPGRETGFGPSTGLWAGRGRGFWGRGGGRGWRNRFYATGIPGWAWGGAPYAAPYATAPTKEQELDMLKGQAEQFETALGDIRKRLQELETEKAAE